MSKTLVLGASTNPERYSYLAARRLTAAGHEVELIGGREGAIGENPIRTGRPALSEIDTVTLYLGPKRQEGLLPYLTDTLNAKRVIFNPGTENAELQAELRERDVEVVEGCTLVMLSAGTY